MFLIKIEKEKCKACKLCIEACHQNLFIPSIKFNKKGYHYIEADNSKSCIGCKRCVFVCPDIAIEIYKEEKEG